MCVCVCEMPIDTTYPCSNFYLPKLLINVYIYLPFFVHSYLQNTLNTSLKMSVFQFMVHVALDQHPNFTSMVFQCHGQNLVTSCTTSHCILRFTTFALEISQKISLLPNIVIKITWQVVHFVHSRMVNEYFSHALRYSNQYQVILLPPRIMIIMPQFYY